MKRRRRPTLVRKRCDKCGKVRHVGGHVRRCKRIEVRFGARFYCYGHLTTIAPPKVPEGAAPKPRVDYERKLAESHAQLGKAISRVKRATTSVTLWQRRVKHYEHQIERRDHPPPPRPKRIKKTRKIDVAD